MRTLTCTLQLNVLVGSQICYECTSRSARPKFLVFMSELADAFSSWLVLHNFVVCDCEDSGNFILSLFIVSSSLATAASVVTIASIISLVNQ